MLSLSCVFATDRIRLLKLSYLNVVSKIAFKWLFADWYYWCYLSQFPYQLFQMYLSLIGLGVLPNRSVNSEFCSRVFLAAYLQIASYVSVCPVRGTQMMKARTPLMARELSASMVRCTQCYIRSGPVGNYWFDNYRKVVDLICRGNIWRRCYVNREFHGNIYVWRNNVLEQCLAPTVLYPQFWNFNRFV